MLSSGIGFQKGRDSFDALVADVPCTVFALDKSFTTLFLFLDVTEATDGSGEFHTALPLRDVGTVHAAVRPLGAPQRDKFHLGLESSLHRPFVDCGNQHRYGLFPFKVGYLGKYGAADLSIGPGLFAHAAASFLFVRLPPQLSSPTVPSLSLSRTAILWDSP